MDLIFYIYIAFLVFGGILAGASMIGGSDHDSHGGLSGGHDMHGLGGDYSGLGHSLDHGGYTEGHQLEGGHHLEVTNIESHPIDLNGDSHIDTVQHHLSESAEAVRFISIRNFIYFSTLFGLSGTVMTLLQFLPVMTFLLSFGLGNFAAFVGYKAVKYLKSSESGEAVNVFDLKGRKGIIVVPATKERKGQMKIEVSGNTIVLIAKVSDVSGQDSFKPGEEAMIIDIKDNTVFIIPVDF